MVDGFTMRQSDGRLCIFEKIDGKKQDIPQGYINVLYNGKVSLWVKYSKSIDLRAIENKYDTFVQTHKIYIHNDSVSSQVRNRRQLLEYFGDRKLEVKEFMKVKKIKVSGRQPESFVPVVEYYDSLIRQKN
jgi:hypothetical protein